MRTTPCEFFILAMIILVVVNCSKTSTQNWHLILCSHNLIQNSRIAKLSIPHIKNYICWFLYVFAYDFTGGMPEETCVWSTTRKQENHEVQEAVICSCPWISLTYSVQKDIPCLVWEGNGIHRTFARAPHSLFAWCVVMDCVSLVVTFSLRLFETLYLSLLSNKSKLPG